MTASTNSSKFVVQTFKDGSTFKHSPLARCAMQCNMMKSKARGNLNRATTIRQSLSIPSIPPRTEAQRGVKDWL
ncbi:hypothetical protein M405DRAFT_807772 [Rhizopogon salebrosus TDB-379]|nr:hypothetical protein M405DRAFT_807772 [Rhizopogon salebrosus TDB-379]